MTNDPRYAFWCEACDWNLIQPSDVHQLGRVQRFVLSLGRSQGQRLADDVIRRRAERPGLDLAVIGAVAIAVLVHTLTLLLAIAGVRGLIAGGISGYVFGGICLGLAWVMRPRVPRINGEVCTRSELPRLYALLDRVAAEVGSGRVDGVVVSPVVNAAFGRSGWRRRRILLLGLPLFAGLDPGERVALLGHELGHAVNGDVGRTYVIAGAVNALVALWSVLEPDSIWPTFGEGLTGYAAVPLRLIQRGLARLVLRLALLERLLCFRTSQRAEYHADAIACRVGGSPATSSLLARLHASVAAARLSMRVYSGDPIDAIAQRFRGMPDREIERLRRVERIEGARFDVSHPPTVDRERVVSALPPQPGSVVLTAGQNDAIDHELAAHRERINQILRDRALDIIS